MAFDNINQSLKEFGNTTTFVTLDDGPVYCTFVGQERVGKVEFDTFAKKFKPSDTGKFRFAVNIYNHEAKCCQMLSGSQRFYSTLAEVASKHDGATHIFKIERTGQGFSTKYAVECVRPLSDDEVAQVDAATPLNLDIEADWAAEIKPQEQGPAKGQTGAEDEPPF